MLVSSVDFSLSGRSFGARLGMLKTGKVITSLQATKGLHLACQRKSQVRVQRCDRKKNSSSSMPPSANQAKMNVSSIGSKYAGAMAVKL